MVNRYDTPAQAQFINTYAPIPFEQMYTLGREAKASVDKALQDLSSNLDKWSDFRSPSAVDTQRWYDETIGKAQPVISEMASNPDLLKTVEGRSKINSLINNVDRAKLSTLMQSKEGLLQRQKVDQQLMLSGKYNPTWHGMDYTNYNTLNTGIFNDVSPLAYKDVRELSDPYYKQLKPGYLTSKGGYDYFGNTIQDIEQVADAHLNDIVNTPEAQKHMQMFMQNTGANAEQAMGWFREEIVQSNIDRTIRPTREANPFALQMARAAKSAKEAPDAPVQFSTKLAAGMLTGGTTVEGQRMRSPYERLRMAFDPNEKWSKQYVSRTTEDGKKITKPRYKSALDIVNSLFQPIGTKALNIDAAELNSKSVIEGLNGQPVFNANGLLGMRTVEQYVNEKMNLGVNQTGWDENQIKFNKDLLNGSIPNVAVTPSDRVAMSELTDDRAQFSQVYTTYIPVKYFLDNFEQFDADTPDELLKSDKFKSFLEKINGQPLGTTGSLLARKSMNIDTDSKNAAYTTRPIGWFGETYDVSQPYDGAYIQIPSVRNVMNNSQTLEQTNTNESMANKLGSKGNTTFRSDNEQLIYGNE